MAVKVWVAKVMLSKSFFSLSCVSERIPPMGPSGSGVGPQIIPGTAVVFGLQLVPRVHNLAVLPKARSESRHQIQAQKEWRPATWWRSAAWTLSAWRSSESQRSLAHTTHILPAWADKSQAESAASKHHQCSKGQNEPDPKDTNPKP